jgi:2,3,4,5-tetrahydropyridine-2-carboxylate N-succinyltransferase
MGLAVQHASIAHRGVLVLRSPEGVGGLPLMADQTATAAHPLEAIIDSAFERRSDITPVNVGPILADALEQIIGELNAGRLRVAEKTDLGWVTHQWIKKAVLLYFRTHDNQVMPASGRAWFDKVPLRFAGYNDVQFRAGGFRVVPPATVRTGTYIGRNVVLMPSYVNIGAYVDEGTMVDTWATVGSCAQIGKNVHLSGGVGIGGVLEPLQANPTIIEDNCFIGARSEVVEGVVVEAHSVLAMGVYLSQSTKIYDRSTGEIHYGRVPSGSVIVPGSLPSADGRYSLACAVIVKRVDEATRAKTSINELLRD